MFTRLMACLCVAGVMLSCQDTGGDSSVVDIWEKVPVGRNAKEIESLSNAALQEFRKAESAPLIESFKCDGFTVNLYSNPVYNSATAQADQQRESNAPYPGFALVLNAPKNAEGLARFRDLTLPHLNARTYYKRDGVWEDVTYPDGFIAPDPLARSWPYSDRILGFDLEKHDFVFVDGKYMFWSRWRDIVRWSKFYDEGIEPKGEYRVEFTTDYELEYPRGNTCKFRLPDLYFTHV